MIVLMVSWIGFRLVRVQAGMMANDEAASPGPGWDRE